MTAPNGGARTTDSRLDLLEYRAGEAAADIQGLRKDMNYGLKAVNDKLGRQLFATWMLVAAILSAAAAIFAAVR